MKGCVVRTNKKNIKQKKEMTSRAKQNKTNKEREKEGPLFLRHMLDLIFSKCDVCFVYFTKTKQAFVIVFKRKEYKIVAHII